MWMWKRRIAKGDWSMKVSYTYSSPRQEDNSSVLDLLNLGPSGKVGLLSRRWVHGFGA